MVKTYFLLAPHLGLVKIGCSKDPLGRMADLRTMNAATVEPLCITRQPEAKIHAMFKRFRKHGEWFTISPSLVLYLLWLGETEAAERIESLLQDV